MTRRIISLIGVIAILASLPVLGVTAQDPSASGLTDGPTAVITRDNFGEIELLNALGEISFTTTSYAWGSGQQFAITTNIGFAVYDTPSSEPLRVSTDTSVSDFNFSNNGEYFIATAANGDLLRWRTDDWSGEPTRYVAQDVVSDLVLRDDGSLSGTRVFSGDPGQCQRIIIDTDPDDSTRMIIVEQSRLYWYSSYCGMLGDSEWLLSAGQRGGGSTPTFPSTLINFETGEQIDADFLSGVRSLPLISSDLRYWLRPNDQDSRGEPFTLWEFDAESGFRQLSDGFGVYGEDRRFYDVLFSPDGSQLITSSSGYFGHRIHVFDLNTAAATGQVPIVQNDPNYDGVEPRGLRFNNDFTATFVTSANGLQIWSWPSREVLWTRPDTSDYWPTLRNQSLQFTTDDEAIVAGPLLYDRFETVSPDRPNQATGFFHPSGDFFYLNGNENRIVNGELERSMTYNLGNTREVGYSADGSAFWIVAGNVQAGFALQVWRHNEFELLYERQIFGSEATLNGYLISPTGDSILARRNRVDRSDSELLLMDVTSGNEYVLLLPAGFTANNYIYSDDGRYVFVYAYRDLEVEEILSGNASFPIREYRYAGVHDFAVYDVQALFESGDRQPSHRVSIPLETTNDIPPSPPRGQSRPTFLPELSMTTLYTVSDGDLIVLRLRSTVADGTPVDTFLVTDLSEFLSEQRPTVDVHEFENTNFGSIAFSNGGNLMATTQSGFGAPLIWGVPD